MPDVFEAISDPTRREILGRLRAEGALSLTELADPLPMSRQAATKHLDVLERARLIRRYARGRERIHELDATPLEEVDDWLVPYGAAWDERLARLRTHLEGADDDGEGDERREASDGPRRRRGSGGGRHGG
jgi:DNA-binding transcriptional ArsR family regulator